MWKKIFVNKPRIILVEWQSSFDKLRQDELRCGVASSKLVPKRSISPFEIKIDLTSAYNEEFNVKDFAV